MENGKRYTVESWTGSDDAFYCIWDNLNERRHDSPLWLTKSLAQNYADSLNETEVVAQ